MKLLLSILIMVVGVGCKHSRYEIAQFNHSKDQAFVTELIDTKYKDSVVAVWIMWEVTATDSRKKMAYEIALQTSKLFEEYGYFSPTDSNTLDPFQNMRIK